MSSEVEKLIEWALTTAANSDNPPFGAQLRDIADTLDRISREREEADQALVDRYRDPKTGVFNFPTDVAAIVRRLDRAERELAEAREALSDSNSLLTAMLQDFQPRDDIEAQIEANLAALNSSSDTSKEPGK